MARTKNNIAHVRAQQGQHSTALQMWQESLDIKIKVLGLDHPDVASTQDNIGCVLDDLGKSEDALEMHKKALQTHIVVLGPDHPVVADTKYKYAAIDSFLEGSF